MIILKGQKQYLIFYQKNAKLISIGRLDHMSEGLILFTNNGDYSRFLELPLIKYR